VSDELMPDATAIAEAAGVPVTEAAAEAIDLRLSHRAERQRRLVLSIGSALLTRPLSLMIPLITLPLFLRYLGNEGYGLYEALGAMAMWLGQSTFGIGMGLMNKLTACHVSGDRAEARSYVSTVFFAEVFIACIGILIICAAVPWIPWKSIFPVSNSALAGQIQWAALAIGITMLVGAMVDTPSAIYCAYQELYTNNIWDAAIRILILVSSFAVVHTRWEIVGVVLVINGVPILLRIINMIWLLGWHKPWLRPAISLFRWSFLSSTLSQGIVFFCLNASLLAIYQSDKLVIGLVLSASQVTAYALLGRLFLVAYGVLMMVLAPLWPAYGEAVRRSDLAWVRRHVSLTLFLGFALILGFGALMLLRGNWIVRVWTHGQPVVISKSLVLAFTAMFLARAWVDCRSVVLNSSEVLKPQVWFFVIHAALNLALSIPMAKLFGVEGVAWCAPATAIATTLWGYPWMMRKHVYRGRSLGAATF